MKINQTEVNKKYKNLTANEINELIIFLDKLKQSKIEAELFVNNLLEQASHKGIKAETIKSLLSQKKTKQTKVKYKLNIDGVEHTYSGIGKKPKWVVEFLSNGGELSTIEVNE